MDHYHIPIDRTPLCISSFYYNEVLIWYGLNNICNIDEVDGSVFATTLKKIIMHYHALSRIDFSNTFKIDIKTRLHI